MSQRKTLRHTAAVAAAAGVLCTALAGAPRAAADTLSDLQKQYQSLQSQEQQLQSTASAQSSAAQTAQDAIKSLNDQIEVAQAQADSLAAQIAAANEKIAAQQQAISDTQAKVDASMTLLKQRLRAIYMAGNESYLEALLSADNMQSLLTRSQVLQTIYKHDQKIITALQAQQAQLQSEEKSLEQTRTQLAAAQQAQQQTQEELNAKKAQQSALADQAVSAAQQAQQQAASVDEQAQKTQKAIDAEYAARAAAARAAAGAAETTTWDGNITVGERSLGKAVLAYQATVETVAARYGMSDYVNLILAVMQQESSGLGDDPMQSLTGEDDPDSNPALSIDVGVQELKQSLNAAGCTGPRDLTGIALGLQGYNYGVGFISWAKSRGGYTYANAQEFSKLMITKLGWSKYGDTQYVQHVLRYYTMP